VVAARRYAGFNPRRPRRDGPYELFQAVLERRHLSRVAFATPTRPGDPLELVGNPPKTCGVRNDGASCGGGTVASQPLAVRPRGRNDPAQQTVGGSGNHGRAILLALAVQLDCLLPGHKTGSNDPQLYVEKHPPHLAEKFNGKESQFVPS